MLSRRLMGVCAAIVVATAACSGGGGANNGLPPHPGPSQGPIAPQGNAYTSYSVFAATLNGESVIDVTPIGTKSALPGASPVAALVMYPDGSLQNADAAGNFDASQSAWALANLGMLATDPSSGPTVDVSYSPASGAAPLPEELSVVAYAPGAPYVPLEMTAQGGTTAAPELATINVSPKSAWLADGRDRIFTAYGKDQTGASFALNKAQVVWSVKRSAACGNAAGTIAALPSDSARALYIAPKTGSTAAGCPDIVTASLASNGISYSGSGSAFSFDPAASPKLAGVLNDASGKPLAAAVIDLYAGSNDAAQGSLLVTTDANGKFSRTVPSSRIITPIVLSVTAGKLTKYTVTPASVNPATAGTTLANQTWKVAGVNNVATPPSPNYAQAVKDAAAYSAMMRAKLPLDVPGSNGAFPSGSVEAILSAPSANATGIVASGEFRKYAYAWDSTAKILTLTQTGTSSEALVYAITINAHNVGSTACGSGTSCYSYTEKRGTMLVADGAWSQQVAAGKYTLMYLANQYSSTHQTQGSPVYVDTTNASVALGSSGTLSVTQTHATPSGATLAQLTTTHSAATAPAVYNYAGTVKAYPGGVVKNEIDYSLSAGVLNEDGSGSFKFLTTNSPVVADRNMQTTWTINAPSTASSSGKRSTGVVDVPSLTNLASGHAASFSIDQKNAVTLTLDASLGGASSTFPL